MKHLILIPILAPLAFAACVPIEPTCGLPNEPVVIGYAKDGNLIYDDQAPLNATCPSVTPPNASTPPVLIPPVLPPVEPPVVEPKWRNNGFGSGNQDAPGGSEFRNRAENAGGNRNGRRASPGNSWPKSWRPHFGLHSA